MTGLNFHTHSHFSDGSDAPEEYIKAAIRQGMHAIGFSDHAPLPFNTPFALPLEKLDDYVRQIRSLQKKYAGQIDIYLSLEMDYVPEISYQFEKLAAGLALDYIIGSVHLVGNKHPDNLWFTDGPDRSVYDAGLARFFSHDIRKAVKAFYDQTNEMIQTQKFEVIGHFDKIKMHNQGRYFTESEPGYQQLVMETLSLIREKNLIVEVNTRGIYKKRSESLFPSDWILKHMFSLDIPVIISSDAHRPDELQAAYSIAINALRHAGYRRIQRFNGQFWADVPLP